MRDHVLAILDRFGVTALFISITLETLGLPMPGESILIAAAAAAGAGKLNIWHVAFAAWTAAVLGDNIGYLIGRRFGRKVILRHGSCIGLTHERYARVEQIAARFGVVMVIAARFFVLLRQFNGLVAGSTGMHWARFVVANCVGAALWVGLWVTVSYRLGREASLLPWIWHHLSVVAMVALPMTLVTIGVLYRRRHRR